MTSPSLGDVDGWINARLVANDAWRSTVLRVFVGRLAPRQTMLRDGMPVAVMPAGEDQYRDDPGRDQCGPWQPSDEKEGGHHRATISPSRIAARPLWAAPDKVLGTTGSG